MKLRAGPLKGSSLTIAVILAAVLVVYRVMTSVLDCRRETDGRGLRDSWWWVARVVAFDLVTGATVFLLGCLPLSSGSVPMALAAGCVALAAWLGFGTVITLFLRRFWVVGQMSEFSTRSRTTLLDGVRKSCDDGVYRWVQEEVLDPLTRVPEEVLDLEFFDPAERFITEAKRSRRRARRNDTGPRHADGATRATGEAGTTTATRGGKGRRAATDGAASTSTKAPSTRPAGKKDRARRKRSTEQPGPAAVPDRVGRAMLERLAEHELRSRGGNVLLRERVLRDRIETVSFRVIRHGGRSQLRRYVHRCVSLCDSTSIPPRNSLLGPETTETVATRRGTTSGPVGDVPRRIDLTVVDGQTVIDGQAVAPPETRLRQTGSQGTASQDTEP
ncbi:MAG: hypothetical protein GXX79_15935 [Actinomycetales bacterium]|nr:hypothetical protein [Actinomycetales bacterium]